MAESPRKRTSAKRLAGRRAVLAMFDLSGRTTSRLFTGKLSDQKTAVSTPTGTRSAMTFE